MIAAIWVQMYISKKHQKSLLAFSFSKSKGSLEGASKEKKCFLLFCTV